jgi:putative peptidoglycan lipid II flippase
MQTRSALVAYSLGLVGLILVKILAPGFYARQNIRTPVKIALITLAATQLLNLAFIGWLRHAGLALSIGLASCLNAGLLLRGLRHDGSYLPRAGWGRFVAKITLALIAMALTLWLLAGPDDAWLTSTATARVIHLAVVVSGGGLSYFVVLLLLGFRLADFRHRAS